MLDAGVLREGAICELGSALAVEAQGGTTVQPWREPFRAAEAAGLAVTADARELADASFDQVVVHLQKSRAASFDDLAEGWRLLRAGGALYLSGPNALGIVSAVKRLAAQLDHEGVILANRARARIVRFVKDAGPGPERETTPMIDVRVERPGGEPLAFTLATRPGVFSAKQLDAGSALLLEALPEMGERTTPGRIVDLGCGVGVLGLAAALLWPGSQVLLVDADARAVACARENVARLEASHPGLAARVRVEWWDARETPLDTGFDLALVNPPFHARGPEVDLGPALALFASLDGWLAPKGRALVVANRTLPWEEPLSRVGQVEELRAARGYKLLSLEPGSARRRSRSASDKGRRAPGARSAGRSRSPTRSR